MAHDTEQPNTDQEPVADPNIDTNPYHLQNSEKLHIATNDPINDKDTSEHNVGNTLIDLEGCDNLWWDAFAASTIAICDIGHGVQECPYEQESGKDANACCR